MKRRDALKTLGALAGATALPKILGGCGSDDPNAGITTLVVLCMENRSYDHYLGPRALQGLGGDGLRADMSNPRSSGTAEPIFHESVSCIPDPPHSWGQSRAQFNAGQNDGFMREYPYERIVSDSRINRIFEGTNEILRLFIALTAMNDVASQLKELSASMKDVLNDPIKGFGVLSDYARKHARLKTGIGGASKLENLDEAIRPQGEAFENETRYLAQATDRILRKHGKNIIGKQFATRRLADIMIDLFVMACTLSRVQASIDASGEEKASKEIEILRVFTREARVRIKRNFRRIDNNEDELLKALADDAFQVERYRWDTI